jgi:hypothetical protein
MIKKVEAVAPTAIALWFCAYQLKLFRSGIIMQLPLKV